MKSEDFQHLLFDLKAFLVERPDSMFAVVGHTPVAYEIVAFFKQVGADKRLLGIYDKDCKANNQSLRPLKRLRMDRPDFVVIASDNDKEVLLKSALPFLSVKARIILGGYGHFSFRERAFEEVLTNTLVPSLANGYPNTLVHIYQCLKNSARLELEGVVAEFGMFKGGTTMLLAKFVQLLGRSWPVIGFDTFAGFPVRRSVLDMYDHPGCVFTDEDAVRNYVQKANIEIVSGDIVKTACRLTNEDIVLAFIDTDNYTSASAVLDVIQDRVVSGGSIVFDHFTGRNRFLYTLGERIAAQRLLDDSRYFNLHDTGVFIKQK